MLRLKHKYKQKQKAKIKDILLASAPAYVAQFISESYLLAHILELPYK
jgi:hypothetical protein